MPPNSIQANDWVDWQALPLAKRWPQVVAHGSAQAAQLASEGGPTLADTAAQLAADSAAAQAALLQRQAARHGYSGK